jgi:hypothetical protein
MKLFCTLFFSVLLCGAAKAQVVINEIYADPSSGNHEFFELYNTSYQGLPASLDGFTVISYFEEGRTKGFYVLDLPNLTIAPKGYFVGSATIPFNFQGNLGSTQSDFSWNDAALKANHGYLRKWVATGNTAADGNRNYDEAPIPAGFNDFFSRIVGNTASYNAFVYKNGVLVNSFLGGTGGNTSLPSSIASMPVFRLETVTQTGSKTYNLTWNTSKNKKPEYVTQDIGSDNGFIRKNDGMCETWDKSSAQAFHTPQRTNGGSQMAVTGLLTIASHSYPGTNPDDPSFVVYNITAGPDDLFPVELHVYADNGLVEGELDAKDTFIELNIEDKLSDGPFTTYFTPAWQDILIVAQTAAGCWDQIKYVPNEEIMKTPLAVKLKFFTGKVATNKSVLEWVVSANETGSYFEIEKSTDGKVFHKTGLVFTTAKEGEEYYTYTESFTANTIYRLKMVNKDKSSSYTPQVLLKGGSNNSKLLLTQNPVTSTLVFNYPSEGTEVITAAIYNAVGAKVFGTQYVTQPGSNIYRITLNESMPQGTYIIEVNSKKAKHSERFIKR